MYKTAQANAGEGTENLTDKNTYLKGIEKKCPHGKQQKKKIYLQTNIWSQECILISNFFLSSLFATLILIWPFFSSINSETKWENEHFHCD